MATLKLNSYELFTQSENNRPEFGAGVPAGCILQVKQGLKTDSFDTSVGYYVDVPNLSVTIKPKFASSNVLINCCIWAVSSHYVGHIGLFQDDIELGLADAAGSRPRGFLDFTHQDDDAANHGIMVNVTGQLLVPVNDTSERIYKIKASSRYDSPNSQTMWINRSEPDRDTNTYDQRHVSTITVMEIAA